MKIVGFGCSYMYGSELLDPTLPEQARDALDGMKYWHDNKPYREQNSFLGLLGESENLAEPGNSLQGMYHQFLTHQKTNTDDTLYVFALTESARCSWYNNQTNDWEHSSWIRWDTENNYHQLYKHHLIHSDCDELHSEMHYATAISFIGVCKSRGFKYVMFNALPNPNTIQDPNFLWTGHSMVEALTIEQNKGKKNYFHEGMHPNELGHKWIAQRLKEFIDSRYPNLI